MYKILAYGLFLTDLKPQNTFYNTENKKLSIIDLGAVEIDQDNNLNISQPRIASYVYTKKYTTPEIKDALKKQ